MSGYLQRMAAAAIKPQKTIHPFVQAMYGAASDAPQELRSETLMTARLEAVRPNAEPPGREWDARETATRRIDERAVRATSDVAREPASGRASEPKLPAKPDALMPELETDASETSARLNLRRDAAREEGAKAQRQDRRRDHERASDTWTFEPLMGGRENETSGVGHKPSWTSADGWGAEVWNPSLHANTKGRIGETYDRSSSQSGLHPAVETAARRRIAQQQAMARAEEHGDEVQIHIGRIEVTAVPPAVPRPVPAPVRKTQTLDEYLRQGRAR